MVDQAYIIAVSGGIDSVVLLDMLVTNRCPGFEAKGSRLIVAHFDHGIRTESVGDAEFVRELAESYGLKYVTKRVELGVGASEETARIERYNFLRQCCKDYNAQLVTAHHQDDLVETMIINLIRGTGWRGLASLESSKCCFRPLLGTPKQVIAGYAQERQLLWKEDSTNQQQSYLRNYVRLTLLPVMLARDPQAKQKLLGINQSVAELKSAIATELQNIIPNNTFDNSAVSLTRYQLVMWPEQVSLEVIHYVLTQLDPDWHPSTAQLKRALHFAKVGLVHKQLVVSGHLKIVSEHRCLSFQKY